MRRSGTVATVLALLSLLIPNALPAQAAIEVADSSGRRVRLAAPARRIVSLAPGITELLFEIGAGARVVGADEASDFPPAAKAVPRVGNSMALNLEQVAALRPDLLIAWPHGAAQRQLAGLRSLGIPVFLSEPDSIEAIAGEMRAFGRLTGNSPAAEERAQALLARARKIAGDHAGREPIRVFVQIWDRPLMTVNDRHLISNALRLCGARNVFADAARLTPTPNREAVAALDPPAIVLLAGPAQAAAWVRDWKALAQLQAVRAGALVAIDPDRLARPTSRLLEGVAAACDALAAHRAPARPP